MTGRSTQPDMGAPPADVLAARHRAEELVSADEVGRAVDRLSVRMSLDLQEANPLLLTVMHGALPFAGWLLTRFVFPLEIGYVHVRRYGDATRGGALEWISHPEYRFAGRTVVILDDVLDRGHTLAELVEWVRGQGAARVATAVLVDKQLDVPRDLTADYAALTCPDRYLFGCGMDYRGYWRNLPAIYALPAELEDD